MDQGNGDLAMSDDEVSTLAAILDEIIPPAGDGRLPGAGVLVAGGDLPGTLGSIPGLEPAIRQGIAAVAAATHDRGQDRAFPELTREERLEVMAVVGEKDPGFLPSLMFLAFATYYRDRRVLEGLGFEARPPHPKGYEMAPGDLTLVGPVRRRGRMYREA